MRLEPVDLDTLVTSLCEAEFPLDLDTLIRRAALLMLEREAAVSAYAPGATYTVGERIRFGGQDVDVTAVRERGNPRQGDFAVIDLRTQAGETQRVVAGVPGAPCHGFSSGFAEEDVAQVVHEMGPQIREALLADERIAPLLTLTTGDAGADGPPTCGYRAAERRASALLGSRQLDAVLTRLTDLEEASARAHFDAITALWRSVEDTAEGLGPQETWQRFIRPALEVLGWSASPLPDGRGFRLFPDSATEEAARARLRQGSATQGEALIVTVPVGWGAPLGYGTGALGGGRPIFEIGGKLATERARWGLLTNGRRWRLYGSTTEDPDIGCAASETFELDLGEVYDMPWVDGLRSSHWEAFRHWWAAFRPGAFVPGPSGRPLMADLKTETATYARRVTQRLRESLLESVLPEIAGGFIAFRYHERGVRTESEAGAREITRASLGLVYRLLFLLYAECHCLLPMGNPDYRGQSLTTLLRWAVSAQDEARPLSRATHATPRYAALLALFRGLEHGAPNLALPSWCGGLFSPLDPDYDFLERHRLSDRVVARTLAALGRVDGVPVDYGALTVRHLSAVGEGLLESMLWIVEASAGQVALVSSQGEPQAPSSLPVPDYIGVSAVERAVSQSLMARGPAYSAAMDRAVASQRSGAYAETAAVRAAATAVEQDALAALLGIKVLDPAMGAGTFLVAALDALVDGVIRLVADYHQTHPWVSWEADPLLRTLDEMREAALSETEAQGVVLDPELLSDDVLLAHLVAERALYGVDLGAAAVALARASLAMRAFAPGAPVLPLDVHVIRGNSLVGLRLADLLDDVSEELDTLSELCVGVTALLSGGEEGSGEDWALASYATVFDLYLAYRLGCAEVGDLVRRLGRDLLPALRGTLPLTSEDQAILTRVGALREEHGFLHWDLAFPDVFLGTGRSPGVQPGFDVVIGNPPTVPPDAGGTVGVQPGFVASARRLIRKPDGRVAFVMLPSLREAPLEGGVEP